MAIINRIEALKDLIQEAVTKGATTVEQIHLSIADLPFSVLEQRGLLNEEGQQLRDLSQRSIGSIYDTIRKINQEIGDLASGIIESMEDHADARHNIERAEAIQKQAKSDS
ncbi:MAG TPA: hypothetical protein VFM46_02995 [Pseudomonadales bacterium]|nr:hypothetical protein [Pseudomonadales bacterium]